MTTQVDQNNSNTQVAFASEKESAQSCDDSEPGGSSGDNNISVAPIDSSNEKDRFEITLAFSAPDCSPPISGWLQPLFLKIAKLTKVQSGQIHILITDDKTMADYHLKYCGKSGTTDVLTFDMRDGENGASLDAVNKTNGGHWRRPTVEGDIIICIDQAKREALKRNHQTRLEVLLYAVHGLLHLLGENDKSEQDYEKMHRRENKLLQAIGKGAVFGKINNE